MAGRQTVVVLLFLSGFVGVMLAAQAQATAVAVELTPTTVDYLPYIANPPFAAPTHTPTPTATAVPPNTPLPPPCAICASDTYNCADFSTQAAAQACHDYCYARVGKDIHRLDYDNDGIACESLP